VIVYTRYRDAEFEEVIKCARDYNEETSREKWAALRGTPIAVVMPACEGGISGHPSWKCGGPWYRVHGDAVACICAHALDFGD
jgi:hypothetical protein